MKFTNRILAATAVATTMMLGVSDPAWAHRGGGRVAAGLFGGMLIGSALRANRDYERESAYRSGYAAGAYSEPPPPRTVVIQQPVAGGGGSAESKLTELADLQRKGLISEQEYQSKKKAILDAM